jgi:hypothetical protein
MNVHSLQHFRLSNLEENQKHLAEDEIGFVLELKVA